MPNELGYPHGLIFHFPPLIPDDFVASVGIDESLDSQIGSPQKLCIPAIECRAGGECQFFRGHVLGLECAFVFIEMIEIFSDQPTKKRHP